MEIKIDATEYNKLIVENDKLKTELQRVNEAYSRTSDALKRFRKAEDEILGKKRHWFSVTRKTTERLS